MYIRTYVCTIQVRKGKQSRNKWSSIKFRKFAIYTLAQTWKKEQIKETKNDINDV